MKKRLVLSVIILFALMLTSCAPAAAPAAEEEAPAAEEAPAEEAAAEEEAAPKCVPATCEDEPVEAVSAADVEAACAGEHGCAVIPAGETVKIGMSSPMTGPYADFGIDAEN
ncbi:MAG: ABC transporter substrate-binding protein, partial [Anaerolineaceae bacterium]|nr:ABC transporter substrate-binding protein [Anaerolineaceae bacterium]